MCEVAHRPLRPVFCLPSSGGVIIGNNEMLRRLNRSHDSIGRSSDDIWADGWEVSIAEQIGVGCSVKRGILSCSPDEMLIASAHTDGMVTVHSCSDGSFIYTLDTTTLPLSGDGRWVVAIHFITDVETSENLCIVVVRLGGVADGYSVSSGRLLWRLDLKRKKRGGNGSHHVRPITAACIVNSRQDQDTSILFASDSKRVTMWKISKKDPWISSFAGDFVAPTHSLSANDSFIAIPLPLTYLSDSGVDGIEEQLMFPPPQVQAIVSPSGDLVAFLDLVGNISFFTICELVSGTIQLTLCLYIPTTTMHHGEPSQVSHVDDGFLPKANSNTLTGRAVSMSWWSATSLIAATAEGEVLLMDISARTSSNDNIHPSVVPTPFMGGKARNSQISCQGSGLSAILSDDAGGVLLCVDQVSPHVVLERHISRGNLEAAETFAKEHDLGQDAVHRGVWEGAARVSCDEGSSSLTVDHVSHLQKIQDNKWVVEEAITQAPNNIEASIALINEGLKRVELGDLGTNLEEKLIKSKCVVEAYQFLDVYMSSKLLPLPSKAQNLGLFRMLPSVPRAAVCATVGCIPALSKLFSESELAGWHLRLLAWIPELVHPREYRHLLVGCEASELDSPSTGGDDNRPLLDLEVEEDKNIVEDSVYSNRYGCRRSIWCEQRAVEVVCGGSHLLHGVELCETGLELLPPNPDTNEEKQEQWHDLVRVTRSRLVRLRNALWNLNCLIVDGRMNACTLPNTQVRKWILEMTPEEWGLAIFANSTPETIAEDVQFYVESLLDPRSGRVLLRKGEMDINIAPKVNVDAVLTKCLIRQVNSSNRNDQLLGMQLAASIVIDSKPTIALDKRIIKSHSHLANIVLEVAYSEGVNDLNMLWQMVECIPVEGEGWSNTDAHAWMDILEQDLIAADILARYDQFKIPANIQVARNKGGKHWLDFRLHQLDCMSRDTCTGPEALDGLFEDVMTIVTRGGFSIEGPTGSKLIWSSFLRRALLDEDFATAWKIMKAVEVDEEVVTTEIVADQCSEELELDKSREKNVEDGEGGRWIEYQLLEAVRVLINDASNVLSPRLKTADQCLALLEQGLGQRRQHLSKIMNNAMKFERDLLKLCQISNKFGLGNSMTDPSYLRMLLMEQKGTNNDEPSIGGPMSVLGTILTQATYAIDLDDVTELADCIGVTSDRLPEAYVLSARSVLSMIIDGRQPNWLCFKCLQYAFVLCKGSDLSSPARSTLEDILVMLAFTDEENNNDAKLDEIGNFINVQPERYKGQIFSLAMNCCHPHDVAKFMDIWHKSGLASDNDSITIDSLLDMASEGLDEVIIGDGDVAMTLSTLLATEAPLKVLNLLDKKIKACKDIADVEGDDVRRGVGQRTRNETFDDAVSLPNTGLSMIENQNEALVAALQKHAFSISLAQRAVQASTDSSLSTALQWCLDHSSDIEDDKLDKAVHPLLRISDNSLGNIRSTDSLQGYTGGQQCLRGMPGLFAIKEAFQCLDAIEEVSAKERAAMAPAPVYTADLEALVHIVASFAETTSALHIMTGKTTLPLPPLQQPSTTSSLQKMPSSSMPEQLEGFGHSSLSAISHTDNYHMGDSASSLALARLLPQYLPGASPLNFVADVTYRSTCLSDLVKRAFIGECKALPLAIVLAQDMGGNNVTPLGVCKDALWQGLIMEEERESDVLMSILKVNLHEEGFTSCPWDIIVSDPQGFLSFLWKVYDTIDSKALSRLSTVLLLTLNILSTAKRESGLSLVQAKAIRANQGLLRRLIKVGVGDLDFKCLVGPDPSQWGTCDSTELGEMAIMELRGCLDPSHVSAVSKLASRLGGLSASDIYMATATRVLCGVTEDIRDIEGLNRLKSPSLDAPEHVWHAWVESLSSEQVQAEVSATSTTVIDTLQPFFQKLSPKDAVCLIEGVCIPGKKYDWCSVTRGAEEEGRQHIFLHPLCLDPKSRQKLVSATLDVISRKGGNDSLAFEGSIDGEWNGEDVVCKLDQFLMAVAEVWPSHSHVVEMAWRNGAEGIKATLIRLVKLGGLSVRTIKCVSDALVLSGSGNGIANLDKECFITVPEVYRTAIEEDLDCITTQLEWPEDEITHLVNSLSQVYESLMLEEKELSSDDDHGEIVSASFTACNIILRNFCTTFKAGESSQIIQRRRMVLAAVSKGGIAPWDKRYGQQQQQQQQRTGDHVVVMNGGGSIVGEKLVDKIEKSATLVDESDYRPSELAPLTLEDKQQSSVRIQAGGLAAVELISRHFSLAPSPKQCSSWHGRLDIIKEISEMAGDSLPQLRVMCDVLSCWLSEDESVEEGQYHYERDLLAVRQWVGVGVGQSTMTETILEDESGHTNTSTLTPLESTAVYVLETLAERFAWTLVQDIFSVPLMQMVLSRSPQTAFISSLLSRADCDKVERKEMVEDETSMVTCPPLYIVVSAALSSRYAHVQSLVRDRIRLLHPEVWNNAPELPSLLLGSYILSESFGISTFPALSHRILSHSSVRSHDVDNVGDKINGGDCYDAAMPCSATSITQTPAYLTTALSCRGFYGPAGAILLEVLGIGRKMRSFDLALHWLGVYMGEGGKILPVPQLVPEMQLCWGEMRKRAAIILAEDNTVE